MNVYAWSDFNCDFGDPMEGFKAIAFANSIEEARAYLRGQAEYLGKEFDWSFLDEEPSEYNDFPMKKTFALSKHPGSIEGTEDAISLISG